MKLKVAGKAKWFVYQKIVIVFILFLIPLISMNIWGNYKGLSFSKNMMLESAEAGATFYAKQLDKEMYFIRSQQLVFINNSDLQKLSFRGKNQKKFDEVKLIDQVRERLQNLMNSSEYVLNAGVYVASIGKTISIGNGVTNTPNAEFELVSTQLDNSVKQSFYKIGDRVFLIDTANNDSIWSYIELSTVKFFEELHQITTLYQQSEAVLWNESWGSVFSTTEGDQAIAVQRQLVKEPIDLANDLSSMENVTGIRYFVIQNFVSSLKLSLVMYVDQNEITRSLSQFYTLYYTFFGVSIIILLLYSFSINVMIHRPLSNLGKAFRMIETDNLNLVIESKTRDEFHYLFQSFNRMAKRLKVSIEENYEQKIALQHSELKQLQSQINPHFLYNSFFNIYMMCKVGDSDSAAELSQKLGSYYEYITRSGSDEVLLDKEFQHALDYCEIQCIRFSNRISYEYTEISNQLHTVYVPRLIIQPIVENVFDHAFEDGTMNGVVYIGASYEKKRVCITVEDNGSLLTNEKLVQLQEQLKIKAKQVEKTGLINVSNRLKLMYGTSSGLFVSRSQYGGLKVELIINFDHKET